MNTPDNITSLKPNEVFVFGSNKYGKHIGGAAKTAYDKYGAVMGFGEGMFGQSYAFPTLGYSFEQLSIEDLEQARDNLYSTCRKNKHLTFFLTKIGCGIAGFSEEEISPLFANAPENLIKPKGW